MLFNFKIEKKYNEITVQSIWLSVMSWNQGTYFSFISVVRTDLSTSIKHNDGVNSVLFPHYMHNFTGHDCSWGF